VILKEAIAYWITAEKSVYVLMKSMEQTPGFSAAQKVMKDHAL
jgi:hypothetical protein